MGRTKDPKNFAERARQKGSEKNTTHINGSEIHSHLELKTRQSYQRQVDNWSQSAKAKSGAGTDDPDPPKEFVQHLAFDIDGVEAYDPDEEVDINAAQGTVVQY